MIDSQKSGVGYFVDSLISSLASNYHNQMKLEGFYFDFLKRGNKHPHTSRVKFRKIWLLPGKLLSICRRFGFQPWLNVFLRVNADIIIFTNYVSLPLFKKIKTAVIIYDLGFLDVPEYVQEKNLAYLKRFCPRSIESADFIITISEFTKKRIENYYPESRNNILVLPIPPDPNRHDRSAVLTKDMISMGIHDDGYLLFVGTLEPRKNIINLIKAYCSLDTHLKEQYSLVLAGGKGWKDGSIRRLIESKQLNNNIITTGYISDSEKNALYNNARGFIMPSHYEGFGMPILEAMQYNIPVAASNIEVFNEVAGDAALYFNKDSVEDMTKVLENLLTNKEARSLLIKKSSVQLKKYSWANNSKIFYEKIIL